MEENETLFAAIAEDLAEQGYFLREQALPVALSDALYKQMMETHGTAFHRAGIGRKSNYDNNATIRRDEICWITDETNAGAMWLSWTNALQHYLNRRLFLGLFSFESHFAHYGAGAFYKRHYDAFRGQTNRVLSLVTYLNPSWPKDGGGELILYRDADDQIGIRQAPTMGTLAIFLSEEFPHEVLPANRDRYSIAGWFRINTSIGGAIDPPQ